MSGYQQVTIIGNVGREPDLRTTQSGKEVASFSVAVNDKWNEQERTEWFNCVAWGIAADEAKNIHRGDMVCALGQMRTEEWTDKDGAKRKTTKMNVSRIVIQARRSAGSSSGGGGGGAASVPSGRGAAPSAAPAPATGGGAEWDNEDIPF